MVKASGPNPYIDTYILKPIGLTITYPDSGSLFIAGQKDTIRWENGYPDQNIAIKYSLDGGWTYTEIPQILNTDSGYFVWDVPDDLLSTKAMIKIIDYLTGEELAESEMFRIKPYIITKLDENGDYVAYDIQTDRWGIGDTPQDASPSSWWFGSSHYSNGIDPFTNSISSQWQGIVCSVMHSHMIILIGYHLLIRMELIIVISMLSLIFIVVLHCGMEDTKGDGVDLVLD